MIDCLCRPCVIIYEGNKSKYRATYLESKQFEVSSSSAAACSEEEEMGLENFMKNGVPFIVMIIVESGEVGMITLGKAAMDNGMSNLVYVVYYNSLGTLLLFPFFIFRFFRSDRPPLTLNLIFRFFLLGLIGICFLQIFAYAGIGYSSPTLATAMGNLIPGFTFLLAVIFRMETLDVRRLTSQAKVLGTIIAISGAFVMTLYKGRLIQLFSSASNLPHIQLMSQQSNWILGGICLAITCICSSMWNILQTATVKEYPDEQTIVFFFCFFGTIQSAIYSLLVERDPEAWALRPDISMIAIIFAAVFGSVFRTTVFTWCLRKKGPVYVSMFKPLGMVIAVILGTIFLGDELYLGSIIGGSIIAVGFYTVMWGQAKEKYMAVAVDDFCALESTPPRNHLLQK
ncbi:hypothetical protein ACET3Z_002715 [Daucus carota]